MNRGPDLFEWAEAHKQSTEAGVARPALDERLCRVLVQSIAACPLSREQIADEVSRLSGARVTRSQIDAWTAESKPGHRFPATLIPAFVSVTGSLELLQLLAAEAGVYVVNSETVMRAEITQAMEQERRQRQRRRVLEQKLRGEL